MMFLTFEELFHIHYEWNEILGRGLCCFSFPPQILASYSSLAGETWTSVLNLSPSNDLPLGSPAR